MYATFRQLSGKFLRSKTFAKAIVSKESVREAVCECTKLKDTWAIRNVWADMVSAHI